MADTQPEASSTPYDVPLPKMTTKTTIQKEFVTPLDGRPEAVAEVASALGKANVNIMGYLVERHDGAGVFRFAPSDPARTEAWLKETRRPYEVNEIVTVPVRDAPGELARVAKALSKSGVSITASYTTSTPQGIAVSFAVDDIAAAKKALRS